MPIWHVKNGLKMVKNHLPLPPPPGARIHAYGAHAHAPQPLGVAEYQLRESLPAELQTSLPSIAQIEREFAGSDTLIDGDSP